MKDCRFLATCLTAAALVSCAPKTSIVCKVAQAPDTDFVISELNVNTLSVLDTVRSDASGNFKYEAGIAEGQPEFIYIYRGGTKIASLLLSAGEKAVVVADTLGNYSVEGSEESVKLQETEKTSADFVARVASLTTDQELGKAYIEYYRERVKYVMSNPFSLTVIPVLFEQLDAASPVFSQYTDAIHFRRATDSLKTVFPESRYVKALEKETARREQLLDLKYRLDTAPALSYPELNLPDINGKKASLNAIDAKVVLVHFWAPSDVTHKMLNIEALMPVYNSYKDKGFEIYSVAVEPDKALWASVVNSQKLPWINVNDGLGTASIALASYNVTTLPASFLVSKDGINPAVVDGEAGLRKSLEKLLK